MLQLDGLVLPLGQTKLMSCGTSIYTYIETYQHALLLTTHAGHESWLSDLWCGWVGMANLAI